MISRDDVALALLGRAFSADRPRDMAKLLILRAFVPRGARSPYPAPKKVTNV